MRDAIALAVGVDLMPQLTLASTVLAFHSSVPIGWFQKQQEQQQQYDNTDNMMTINGCSSSSCCCCCC